MIKHGSLKIEKTQDCPTLVPFSWYIGELTFNQKKLRSSGEGFDSQIAQARCIGELFERIPLIHGEMPCLSLFPDGKVLREKRRIRDSNGLSYALSVGDGVFNSYRELLERQVVLDFWLNKKKCFEISLLKKMGHS